jgi:HAD superfamily hydrolase (TIGR01509 family)
MWKAGEPEQKATGPMPFEFIFWDNDGVLVDTEGLYYQASQEALARIGFELTVQQFTSISLSSGHSVFELATIDENLMDQLRLWRNRRYSDLLAGQNLLLPGVKATLTQLAAHKRMGVVTSSRRDHFDLIHARTDLLHLFDFILCREDYRAAKPEPEPYLLALQRSGRDPRHCLVIEDSIRGLSAAKAAGLTCWVIPSQQTAGQDFSEADRILDRIDELPELLG